MDVVDENTEVVVGKYYKVHCAIVQGPHQKRIVPVIGIAHRDPQFGPAGAELHYHIDGRFAKAGTDYFQVNEDGTTNGIVTINDPDLCSSVIGMTVRRMLCKRLTTGLKPPKRSRDGSPSTYVTWYAQQIGKSCAGRKCPHLGTVMHERDGRLVCPLHNLQGCIKTEKIVRPKILSNQS